MSVWLFLLASFMAPAAQEPAVQSTTTVNVLVSDYGFKQAVASGDHPTIRSALVNHAARVRATVAVLLDPDGRVWVSSTDDDAAMYAAGFIGVGTIASVAFFAARGSARVAILTFALAKLVIYGISILRKPEFRVAAMDYGVALAVLLGGAVYGLVRWQEPGATWLIAGVAVSLVAGLVQGFRVAPHRWFNHNDLFHVIQTVALYLFFRGGALLVDR